MLPKTQNVFYARRYGARGDGARDDTAALQALIDGAGGAARSIVLDKGVFLCGTLYLKSGVTLEILPEAKLQATGDIAKYPCDTHCNRYKNEEYMDQCFIFAENAENIALCGGGEINGNAAFFRRPENVRAPRPMLLRFLNCKGIELKNIKLFESAAWTCAFLDSEDISITDVTVRSVTNLNGDGFDFDGCHDIRVENCRLHCSDDAICFQAGEKPTHHALVKNCRISSLCAGVRVGIKSMSDIHDITVAGCLFEEVWREGLKIEASEGGEIRDISLINCVMRDVRRPFWFLLNNDCFSKGSVLGPFGMIQNVTVRDLKISCTDQMKETQFYFYGDAKCLMGHVGYDGSRIDAPKEKMLQNITFENIDYAAFGGFQGVLPEEYPPVRDKRTESILPSSSNYWPDWSRAVFFDIRNVKNLRMKNITYHKQNPDIRPDNLIE